MSVEVKTESDEVHLVFEFEGYTLSAEEAIVLSKKLEIAAEVLLEEE